MKLGMLPYMLERGERFSLELDVVLIVPKRCRLVTVHVSCELDVEKSHILALGQLNRGYFKFVCELLLPFEVKYRKI